jgi:hypothetical protein
MGEIIKVQRPVSSASISGLYVILRGQIYNSFAGGIIVQLNINESRKHECRNVFIV